jgi:hypothetical protein
LCSALPLSERKSLLFFSFLFFSYLIFLLHSLAHSALAPVYRPAMLGRVVEWSSGGTTVGKFWQ